MELLSVIIVINSFPSSISKDSFNINVTISGAKAGTNYLRAELYKDGSKNYFGETFNGASWYGGSDGTQYFPVQITGASSSATFEGRLGEVSSTDYLGSGTYKLKIKRYTSSGSAASGDDENPVDISINYDLSTPVPTASIAPLINSTPFVSPVATVLVPEEELIVDESKSTPKEEVLSLATTIPTMTDSGIETSITSPEVQNSTNKIGRAHV